MRRCARGSAVAALAIAAAVLGAMPAGAHAQSVAEARRMFFEARFRGAIETFEQVLDQPSLTREDAVEAHRFLASLRQLEGDGAASREHVRIALALDGTAAAPEGSPEEVSVTFRDVAAELGGERARIEIRADGEITAGREVEIEARALPVDVPVVTMLELRCASGAARAEETGPIPSIRVAITPEGARVDCRAFGRTSSHATLLDQRAELTAHAPEHSAPRGATEPVAPASEGGGSALVWTLGVGGAVLVLGAAFLITFLVLRPDLPNEAVFGLPTVEGW